MTCPQCGAPGRDDARFCGACGAATSSTEPASSPSLGEAPVMIGREIAGRYRVLAKIGEGGMGAVFRAEQISLKRTIALKLLRPEVVANPQLLRRFNAEAEAVAKLNHPNTVNIYDFGQDTDGTLFIAMELIEGRSLRGVLQGEAPLPPHRALAIATQVAASLIDAHAHAIVHRDLKPDNVMLQDRGRERDVARVLDFGIAKLRDDNRATQLQMTQQGDMLGTPQYMAPEQIRAEKVDGRTDIYALGCLLYEMVTGRLPHEATTVLALLSKHLLEHPVPPSQRRPDLGLPPALDALILGAMAKDPQARPATMEAFRDQIAALLATLPPDPRSAADPRLAMLAAAAPGGATPAAPTPAPLAAPYAPVPYGAAPTPAHAAYPPTAGPPYSGAPPTAGSPYSGAPPSAGSPYGPSPGPPLHHAPSHHAFPHRGPSAPPPRRSAFLVLGVAVAAGAAVTAAILALRSTGPAVSSDAAVAHLAADGAAPPHDAQVTPPPDPWAPTPGPTPPGPRSDPWNQPVPAIDGKRVEVGEGVALIVPPGFTTKVEDEAVIAEDARGILIIAGPLDLQADQPDQFARRYARHTGMSLEAVHRMSVGGQNRPLVVLRGRYKGARVRHIAVPLIGPGYRVVVVVQVPARIQSRPEISSLAFDLYTRRIVLP